MWRGQVAQGCLQDAPVPPGLAHEPGAKEAVQGEGDGRAATVTEPPGDLDSVPGAFRYGPENALLCDVQLSEWAGRDGGLYSLTRQRFARLAAHHERVTGHLDEECLSQATVQQITIADCNAGGAILVNSVASNYTANATPAGTTCSLGAAAGATDISAVVTHTASGRVYTNGVDTTPATP